MSGKRNYSIPVSFVSGGVQQAGKQKTRKTNEENMDTGDDSEDDEDDGERDDETGGRRGRRETVNSSRCVDCYVSEMLSSAMKIPTPTCMM
jgi:hypothetical protein